MVKIRIFISCFVILLFASCSSKPIYYQYNGTTVTRIDRDGEICFYYGKCNESKSQCPYVKAEYSGFNSGVDALLLFKKDGTVEVIGYGGGYFTEHNKGNRQIYYKTYENPQLDSLVTSYKGNFTNLIRVSDVLDQEKISNRKNQSQVKAEYPKE